MKKQIKSFFQVLSSNIFVSFAGIATGILIPILVSELEFGYWQYYLTYASYAGLMLFGFCDGIYIRFGGMEYNSLEKHRLNAMFYFMITVLSCLSLALLICIRIAKINDTMKVYTLYMVIVSAFLQCVISFFTLLNQGTGRFKIYSIGNIIDRLILLVVVVICLITKSLNIVFLLWTSIASKCVLITYYFIFSRDIVFHIPRLYCGFGNDIKENISAGLPITLCGIISLLMGGYAKIFIEWTSGMINLAYFSFAFSSVSIISQVIVAASLVVFPALKRTTSEGVKNFLSFGENVTDLLIPIIMFCYFPVYIAVKVIVPKYMMSLSFIPVVLPVIVFQSKINVLYSNTYKVMRKERKLFLKGLIAFASNIFLVSVMYIVSHSLLMAAVATSLSYVVWYYSLRAGLDNKISIMDAVNLLYITVCILLMVLLDYYPSMAAFAFASIVFFLFNNKKIRNLINSISMLKKE